MFNDAASNCLYHTEWLVNEQYERVWQEKMVVKSEVLHGYLSDETEENHRKTQPEYPMFWYSNISHFMNWARYDKKSSFGVYVQYPPFLSDLNETGIFLIDF
jgi:hypothetical protein